MAVFWRDFGFWGELMEGGGIGGEGQAKRAGVFFKEEGGGRRRKKNEKSYQIIILRPTD